MIDPDPLDDALAGLLAPEAMPPGPEFVARIAQLVAAQAALKAQRRRMVRDWLWQMAALAALVAGLAVYSRLPGLEALPRTGLLTVASPLALVVALWLFASGAVDPARRRGATKG